MLIYLDPTIKSNQQIKSQSHLKISGIVLRDLEIETI